MDFWYYVSQAYISQKHFSFQICQHIIRLLPVPQLLLQIALAETYHGSLASKGFGKRLSMGQVSFIIYIVEFRGLIGSKLLSTGP